VLANLIPALAQTARNFELPRATPAFDCDIAFEAEAEAKLIEPPQAGQRHHPRSFISGFAVVAGQPTNGHRVGVSPEGYSNRCRSGPSQIIVTVLADSRRTFMILHRCSSQNRPFAKALTDLRRARARVAGDRAHVHRRTEPDPLRAPRRAPAAAIAPEPRLFHLRRLAAVRKVNRAVRLCLLHWLAVDRNAGAVFMLFRIKIRIDIVERLASEIHGR
jgi:hypothetical protein